MRLNMKNGIFRDVNYFDNIQEIYTSDAEEEKIYIKGIKNNKIKELQVKSIPLDTLKELINKYNFNNLYYLNFVDDYGCYILDSINLPEIPENIEEIIELQTFDLDDERILKFFNN